MWPDIRPWFKKRRTAEPLSAEIPVPEPEPTAPPRQPTPEEFANGWEDPQELADYLAEREKAHLEFVGARMQDRLHGKRRADRANSAFANSRWNRGGMRWAVRPHNWKGRRKW